MPSHKDSICGVQIDEQNAAGKSDYQGQTYYFCSHNCKPRFDQNPEQDTG